MKQRQKLLTDEQWNLVEPMLPPPRRRRDNRGRPWASNRGCFEGILWILQTGAAWRFLPEQFPSPSTCWRRLRQWEEEGVWLNAWRILLGALDEEGLLKWEETFLDGSFAPAKKGVPPSGKPSGARGRSGWYWSMVKVFRWESTRNLPRLLLRCVLLDYVETLLMRRELHEITAIVSRPMPFSPVIALFRLWSEFGI
jgi:transposase